MYPLYWTTSKGDILMRYSYEFKRKAIELFYQDEWPKTPNGVRTDIFHRKISDWVKLERLHGSQWVHKYKTLGYNGLTNKPKGRIKILQ
jgi:transposase